MTDWSGTSQPVGGADPEARTRAAPLPWAWLFPGTLLAFLVLFNEIGLLLTRVQAAGQQAHGPGAFTAPRLPPWDDDELEAALTLWREDESGMPGRLVAAHLGFDFPFALLVAGFLVYCLHSVVPAGATRRWRKVLLLPGCYAALDLAETGVTWWLLGCAGSGCTFPEPTGSLWLVPVLSVAKWGALALSAIKIVVVYTLRDQVGRVDRGRAVREWPSRPRGAASALTAVVVVFALVIALPGGGPLDQVPDVLRGQFETPDSDTGWALVFAGLLVAVVAVAGAWTVRSSENADRPPPVGTPMVIAAALSVTGALFAVQAALQSGLSSGNLGPLAPVLVVAALAIVSWGSRRWLALPEETTGAEPPRTGHRPDRRHLTAQPPWSDRRWRVVGLQVGLVVFALGIGLLRAFAPLALTEAPAGAALWAVTGAMTAALLAPVTAVLATVVLPGVTGEDRTPRRLRRAALAVPAAVTVAAAARLMVDPSGHLGGPTGVLATCFAFFAVVTGVLGAASHWRHWHALDSLRLHRTPWGLLVVVVWLVASVLDSRGGYHDARVAPAVESARPAPKLRQAAARWTEQWQSHPGRVSRCLDANGRLPLVLVAAPGGGGKAAYWTGASMDALFGSGTLCPQSLFAVSGVSGGAVGLTVTLAQEPSTGLGPDPSGEDLQRGRATTPLAAMTEDGPLSEAVAAMLLRDLPQPFLGAPDSWADRAEVLERSWERAADTVLGTPEEPRTIDDLGAGWWTPGSGGRPVVVLNSTSVVDGCRILLSNVRGLPTVPGSCGASASEESVLQGPAAFALDGRAGLLEPVFPRPASGDSCGHTQADSYGSLPLATAALMAARFPYVTPSGALRRCVDPDGPGREQPQVEVVYGVDGGYMENTGIPILLEVWTRIAWRFEGLSVASRTGRVSVEPWVVLLENHYRGAARPAPPRRPKELWVPPSARAAKGALLSSVAWEQRAAQLLRRPLRGLPRCNRLVMMAPRERPEVQAPLGWALAESSRRRMRADVADAFAALDATGLLPAGAAQPPCAGKGSGTAGSGGGG